MCLINIRPLKGILILFVTRDMVNNKTNTPCHCFFNIEIIHPTQGNSQPHFASLLTSG